MKNKSLQELSNKELWELFPVILTEYIDQWEADYLSEREQLIRAIGGNNIVRINPIGSTAVQGLLAKPTIDILVEIEDRTDLESLIKSVEEIGYIYSPQPNNPAPHMMFMKGYTPEGFRGKVYHVHVRYLGDWDELYFRDYLIQHRDTANLYGELKLKLKERYEHDRDGYTLAKTEFIHRINKLARKEFPGKYI